VKNHPQSHGSLKNQDSRNAVNELRVLSLVPENVHSKEQTNASAHNSSKKQRTLTNTPPMCPRPMLVDTGQSKGKNIDNNKVDV
jgi:hypothetical protein